MDIASHFTAQQEPCTDVTIITVHHTRRINSRERHGGIRDRPNRERDFTTGGDRFISGCHMNAIFG